MDNVKILKRELKKAGNDEKAKTIKRFFKTKPGQYGEGDIFYGIMIPETKEIAKKYSTQLTLDEVKKLIYDKVHEVRQAGLLILADKFEGGAEKEKKEIYNFYIKHAKQVNNWDLVDITASRIVGHWLLDKDRNILYKLAKSDNLWKRRISIISCFAFIKRNDFKDALKLGEFHLKDKHDLIHKAVGWMLREIGNKEKQTLINFLNKNYKNMPRTTLRYSIEKFDEVDRKKWMKK